MLGRVGGRGAGRSGKKSLDVLLYAVSFPVLGFPSDNAQHDTMVKDFERRPLINTPRKETKKRRKTIIVSQVLGVGEGGAGTVRNSKRLDGLFLFHHRCVNHTSGRRPSKNNKCDVGTCLLYTSPSPRD